MQDNNKNGETVREDVARGRCKRALQGCGDGSIARWIVQWETASGSENFAGTRIADAGSVILETTLVDTNEKLG
jgi:hypothetical protein